MQLQTSTHQLAKDVFAGAPQAHSRLDIQRHQLRPFVVSVGSLMTGADVSVRVIWTLA